MRRLTTKEEKLLLLLYKSRSAGNVVNLDQVDSKLVDNILLIINETQTLKLHQKERDQVEFTQEGLHSIITLKNKSRRQKILQKMTSEDYLLAIDNLTQTKKGEIVPMSELARSLSLSNSSISEYIRTMQNNGKVIVIPRTGVKLTEDGKKTVRYLKQKADVLYKFINKYLKIDSDLAEVEAHVLEHNTSPIVIERLQLLVDQLERIEFNLELNKFL